MNDDVSVNLPWPTTLNQSNRRMGRSKPFLRPSQNTTLLSYTWTWFSMISALVLAPILAIWIVFNVTPTGVLSSSSVSCFDASDLAKAVVGWVLYWGLFVLLTLDAIRPNLLQLRKLFAWPRVRYRRGHILQLRYRQRRRLGEGGPMTIFVNGIAWKPVPLVVNNSTRLSDVVDALRDRRCIPIKHADLASFYLLGPNNHQVSCLADRVSDPTMLELGIGPLSNLQLRVRLLGGTGTYENPNGWALDENNQLMDADKMGNWPYDPDETVKAPNASGSTSSSRGPTEPRKSTRPRDTSKYDAYISAQRQDDDGNPIEPKKRKPRKSRKGKEKERDDDGEIDDSGSDYKSSASGSESESEDEDRDNQVTNEEASTLFMELMLCVVEEGPNFSLQMHSHARRSLTTATGRLQNDKLTLSQAAGSASLPPSRLPPRQRQLVQRYRQMFLMSEIPLRKVPLQQRQGKKKNPIYLFYEEVDASYSSNQEIDTRDKHYRCYHGSPRKTITLKHSSRGNLITLVNHLKTRFPLLHKLYEALHDRDSPPTPAEVDYASGKTMFDGDVAQEFLKTNQKSQRTLDAFCQGGRREPWDQQKFERLLVDWIVACDQPFEEVERPEFRALLNYVHQTGSDLAIPSRTTIKRRIMSIGEETERGLQTMFAELDSKVSISLDNWTSPNNIAFMAIVAHYVTNKGKIEECLIDFRELIGQHSGENMADAVWDTLQRYGIQSKILAFVMDNASNNDTLLEHLENRFYENGIDFDATFSHIRCMPHIIHLSAVKLLESIGAITAAESERSSNRNYQESVLPSSPDQGDDIEVVVGQDQESMGDKEDARTPIEKLRKIVLCARSSPQRRKGWLQAAEDFIEKAKKALTKDVPKRALMLILDVRTRWSSTYQMLKRAIDFSSAVDTYAAVTKDLRDYEMTEQDWVAIRKVCIWLKAFRDATTQMSTTKKPMLSRTHFIFRGLQDHLQGVLRNLPDDINPDVKLALTSSHRKLSDYYYKIDQSPLYIWSCFLDPRISYEGIKKEFQDEREHATFLERKKKDLREYFEKNYPPETELEDSQASSTFRHSSRSSLSEFGPGSSSDDLEFNFMARFEMDDHTVVRDELNDYFKLPRESMKSCDPISWWYARKRTYPRLYRLARDVLSIPGSAVAVERVFSGGRDTISLRRANLNADTIRTLMIMKNRLRTVRNTAERLLNDD